MNTETRPDFSEERLNAFVDGELASAERDEILAAAAEDAGLGQRLCQLRATKELLRHAYEEDCLPAQARGRPRRAAPPWRGALAAGVALAVGVLIGMHGLPGSDTAAQSASAATASLAVTQPARMLIHLDHAEAEHMEAALDLVEAYLARAQDGRIEVLVNSHGLDLLRADRTPHAGRIAGLLLRHDNVSFIACDQAIARFERAGQKVVILPQAVRTRSAIAHIADRLQAGWTYVKV